MSYCPKCGAKVREEMSFCPKCGASLKVAEPKPEAEVVPPVAPAPYRAEKAEKGERREKEEKTEKREKEEKGEKEERREKREYGFMGPLVGGVFLVVVGYLFYLVATGSLRWEAVGAVFFILIGIIVLIGAVYAAVTASRRHPRT